jgi:hypothetical protein
MRPTVHLNLSSRLLNSIGGVLAVPLILLGTAACSASVGTDSPTSLSPLSVQTSTSASAKPTVKAAPRVTPKAAPTRTPTRAPAAVATTKPPPVTRAAVRPPATHSAATPPPAPAHTSASCYPLTNGGKCYEPGEFCRNSDHGASGLAGDGKQIVCRDNNGWRWEPA